MEVVSFFPCDADLSLLQGALDFGSVFFHGLDDLLGLFAIESLLDQEVLGGVAEWRDGGVFSFNVPEIDISFGEFANDDFVECLKAS